MVFPELSSRTTRISWRLAGRLLLYTSALAVVSYLLLRYAEIRRSEEGIAKAASCKGNLRQLGLAVAKYIDENGAPPYCAHKAGVADPYLLGKIPDPFAPTTITFSCPLLALRGRREGSPDSGYRMLNWPKDKWVDVLNQAVVPDRGLPVMWCAQRHAGGRIALVVEHVVREDPRQVMVADSIRSARLAELSDRELRHLLSLHGITCE